MRLFRSLLIIAVLGWAATSAADLIYVDAACSPTGNGTGGYNITCDASADGNPTNSLQTGVNAINEAGDKVVVRGIHSAHNTNCPGDTIGGYYNDVVDIDKTVGASGNPIIVEANGWTADRAYTQEQVFVITTNSTTSWTQCVWDGSACDCGANFLNVQIGTEANQTSCEQTWYEEGSGNTVDVMGAIKKSGEPTFRVCGPAQCLSSGFPCSCCTSAGVGCESGGFNGTEQLTNAHSTYDDDRCSTETWRVCDADADCPRGGTCDNAASPEVDSLTCSNTYQNVAGCVATPTILARWGTGANAPGGANQPRPYIFSSGTGNGFRIGVNTATDWLIVRGFIFISGGDEGVHMRLGETDITIEDSVFAYRSGHPAGSDYGISSQQAVNVDLVANEFMDLGSEPIHTESLADENGGGSTDIDIRDSYFHHIGSSRVVGEAIKGTPTCGTFGDTGPPGDYTGSIIENNIWTNHNTNVNVTYCVNFENDSDGWIFRNNIIKDVNDACVYFNGVGGGDGIGGNSNIQFYNNLLINCGAGTGGQGAITITTSGPATTTVSNNNLIFNNTIVNSDLPGIFGNGSLDGNIIQNNILHSATGAQGVHWANSTTTNLFRNNLVFTSANPAVRWDPDSPGTFACADIDNIDTGNIGDCPSPAFVSSTDFHIQASSPAKDAGSSTNMPAGKTLDICNNLASLYGFVSYNDCQAIINSVWDIGADEFAASSSVATSQGIKLNGTSIK